MGNWMTVQIVGSCSKEDVPKLREAVKYDTRNPDQEFHCLSHSGGLAGLPLWPAEAINAVGNLAERDYAVEDVAETLTELARIAPSLSVKVHCGGDYESKICVATVNLVNGKAAVKPPEIEGLPDAPEGQWLAHLHQQMYRQR